MRVSQANPVKAPASTSKGGRRRIPSPKQSSASPTHSA